MKTGVLELNGGALARHELPTYQGEPYRRRFEVRFGGEKYLVTMDCQPETPAFAMPDPDRMPDLGECAEVISILFKTLLVPDLTAAPNPFRDADVKQGPPPGWMRVTYDDGSTRDYRLESRGLYLLAHHLSERKPDLGDELLASFDRSEREDGPSEVDPEAGWKAYCQELLETMGPHHLPEWKDAPQQLKECFAAGIWKAIEGVAAEGVVASLLRKIQKLEQLLVNPVQRRSLRKYLEISRWAEREYTEIPARAVWTDVTTRNHWFTTKSLCDWSHSPAVFEQYRRGADESMICWQERLLRGFGLRIEFQKNGDANQYRLVRIGGPEDQAKEADARPKRDMGKLISHLLDPFRGEQSSLAQLWRSFPFAETPSPAEDSQPSPKQQVEAIVDDVAKGLGFRVVRLSGTRLPGGGIILDDESATELARNFGKHPFITPDDLGGNEVGQ